MLNFKKLIIILQISALLLTHVACGAEYRLIVPTVSAHIGGYDVYTVVDGSTTESFGSFSSQMVTGQSAGGNVASADYATLITHREELNNENFGLGIEVEHSGYIYTIVVLDNSFKETSVYLGFSKEERFLKSMFFSYGITAANGYDVLTDNGYLLSPNISIRFNNIRLSTTYPFANITCPADKCADVINLQYVMPF
jgi:hypothetical protein